MRLLVALMTTVLLSQAASADPDQRARFNWMMNCQGCHQADGAGSKDGAPNMRGLVARMLDVQGGRAYLGQVPGVAYAPLGDEELAELLNWLLKEYDSKHMPASFQPYSAEEIGALRRRPLIDEAPKIRSELIAVLEEAASTGQ